MSRATADGGDDVLARVNDDSAGFDEQPPKKRRRVLDILMLVASLLLLTGAVGCASIIVAPNNQTPSSSGVFTDLNGSPIVPDDSQVFDPSFSAAASQVNQITPTSDGGGGLRFQVPSLGMNVPLGAINAVDNSLNPANYTNAFWVRNLGVSYNDPSTGTVYVVMHSARTPGYGPGNYFFNEDTQAIKVNPGDQIEVAEHTYAFQSWSAVNKPDLPGTSSIWENTPNRLIIITCLQNPQHTESEVNLVLVATLVS